MLLYHKSCKKKSGKLWNSLPLCCVCRISFKYASYIHLGRENIISHIQHFINDFQAIAHRLPGVVGACCNVGLRKPLNIPQKSYLSVNPPKRRVFDGGYHLLSVKPLQAQWQHYTSRRHGQHRARKAAAALRRCALERSQHGNVPFCRRWQNSHTLRATKSGTHADHNNSVAFARM